MCVLVIKYRYRIQEPEKLTNNVSLSNEKKIYKHSWCVRVRCRTRWNTIRVQTGWNPSEPVQINPFEPVETRSDLLRFQSTQWIIFYFSIFIFSILYLLPPPPPPPPSPPPPISPLHPHILFIWGRGGGGEGRGTGRGRRRHRGGATTTTAGRSVAPPKGGGDKVPPPFSIKQKKTKFTNQTTYVL